MAFSPTTHLPGSWTQNQSRPLFYDSSLNGPILFGLQFTVRGHRTGIAVVDECDAMADENAILNIDTFTDKRVTGDFAILSNSGVFLNFDEGANLCVIADFTSRRG